MASKSKILEYETKRASVNLDQLVEYRKMLEWVVLALDDDIYTIKDITQEIKLVLK